MLHLPLNQFGKSSNLSLSSNGLHDKYQGGRKKERILQGVQYAVIHNQGKFKGGSHEVYWGFSSSGIELC